MTRVRLDGRWLRPVTLAYLGFPVVLWLCGWLRPAYAAMVLLVAVAAIIWQLLRRDVAAGVAGGGRVVSPVVVIVVILVAVAWVAVSGVGGWGTQTWDSQFHQSVLRDLAFKPWPVAYETDGRVIAMVYSMQSYLPAAVVGSWWGWEAANHAWAAWVATGLSLCLLWYLKVVRCGLVLPLAVFALSSGLDAVGLAMHSTFAEHPPDFHNPEWWARHFQYSANATLLFYVPHYAIPSWLVALFLLDDDPALAQARSSFLVMALAFLWSPFAFLGAGALAIVVLIRSRARGVFTPLNLLGVAVFLVGFVFYLAKITGSELPGTRMPTGLSFFALPHHGLRRVVDYLFLHPAFCLLEFGILAAVLVAVGRRWGGTWYRGHFRWCLLASCIWLAVLPAFRMGQFNDLVMRSSIGGLLVVMLAAVHVLQDRSTPWRARLTVAIVLAGGLLVPIQEWRRHWPDFGSLHNHVSIRSGEEVPDMNGLFRVVHTTGFYDQFMGATDTWYFERLAPELDPNTDRGPGR